jgi:hypothetical protein
MAATDPARDGTFDILDNLPDKIRPKYVDKLTRDQMAQVILSVWRERDAANANVEKQCMLRRWWRLGLEDTDT